MTQMFKRIDENTSLPFKVVVPLLVAIVSTTIWIQSTLFRIQAAQKEFVTHSEIALWRNQLAEQNQQLKVPFTQPKP